MFTPRSFGKVGVEAYAAYALRAWLARDQAVSGRTRRFAKWSAICAFALGMAGQIAYHLLAQAGAARAPWPVTTVVSCLPVLVLAMGTALAHMLRADAGAARKRRTRWEGRTSHVRRALPAPPGTRQDRSRTSPQARGQRPCPVRNPGPGRSRSRTAPPSGPARRFTPRSAGRAWPPAGLPLRAVRYPGAPCATRA